MFFHSSVLDRQDSSFAEKRGKQGFSLIEVLISMFLLAVGVIGATGMLLASLRTTQQSALQAAALQLAADMAEVIRAHASGAGHTERAAMFPTFDFNSSTTAVPAAPATLCYLDTCDATEQLDFELYEWKRRIASTMPAGRATVCYDTHPWDDSGKKLRWDCDGSPGGNAPLVIKLGWQAKDPDGKLVRESDNSFSPSVVLVVSPV